MLLEEAIDPFLAKFISLLKVLVKRFLSCLAHAELAWWSQRAASLLSEQGGAGEETLDHRLGSRALTWNGEIWDSALFPAHWPQLWCAKRRLLQIGRVGFTWPNVDGDLWVPSLDSMYWRETCFHRKQLSFQCGDLKSTRWIAASEHLFLSNYKEFRKAAHM